MRELTLVLPYFQNKGMFEEQQRVWMDYPEALRAALHVILVDDASEKAQRLSPKQIAVQGLASLRMYRTRKKVRWNWLFSRNLGVQEATTAWVLLTDIDHVMPAQTLDRLVHGSLEERNVYRFSRADAPHRWPYDLCECPGYKPHPNTWLMTTRMFTERIGGYDERLSGCYGTDGEFRDRVKDHARAVVLLSEVMIRYPREVIEDASTLPSVYTRKGDPANDEDLCRRRAERAEIKNWRPLRVTFPYEQIYDSRVAVCSPS